MRWIRIYYQGALGEQDDIGLSHSASHHLINVLRIKLRDTIIVFNGEGNEYLAEVNILEKKIVGVHILKKIIIQRESSLSVELAQGISRGDRMDYVIQKAVELGVDEITPLFTERCEIKLNFDRVQRKMEHWQGVIVGACEQSGRLIIPRLNMPQTLELFLQQKKSHFKMVCVPDGKSIRDFAETFPKRVTLLIGPEGGLSDDEVMRAIKSEYHRLGLGPRILRTETATVVAVSVVQACWGDL